VLTATGRGLAQWHGAPAAPLLPRAACDCYTASVDIAELNLRIADRFAAMLERGALDECRQFLASGQSRQLPAARALGAAQLFDHLEGKMTLDAAIAAGTVATRRYAKRQRTWLRRRMADWVRLEHGRDPLDSIAAD
jgi:tRNA dimethylallyltransferase